MSNQSYSAEDVQRILSLAMDNAAHDDETFSAVSLAEMARELGIGNGVLSRSVTKWQLEKVQLEKHAVVLRQKQQSRSRFLRQALIPYMAVNAFLMVLNVALVGAITWAIYPLLGWGLALCLGFSSRNCQKNDQQKRSGVRLGCFNQHNNAEGSMLRGDLS